MNKEIKIKTKKIEFKVVLNDTKTAESIAKSLPFKSIANTWGNEIYFTIPVAAKLEKGVEIVDIGTVAFWPPGNALCIFFGKTPASVTEKPQAVSPVTIVGSIEDKKVIESLKLIKSGDEIEVVEFSK